MSIKELIVELSNDPFNPDLNLRIAEEYERLGQSASAVSFYLRTAEYGYETHYEHVYASLLKSALSFSLQKNRELTVQNLLFKAIAYQPTRPEGWFLLSRYMERTSKYQEAYTYAEVGLSLPNIKLKPLPIWVDYPGRYGLTFEKAVSSWWVGRKDECTYLFKELLNEKELQIDIYYAIKANLKKFGEPLSNIDPLEPVVTNYRKFFGDTASVIIDVGTRDGDDADYLFKALNGDKVIAIDASPDAVTDTRTRYPWMTVLFGAAAESEGSITFHQVTSDNKEVVGTSSIFSKNNPLSRDVEFYKDKVTPITVPTFRMESVLTETPEIDVVKIDTEGYTWQVLQGFGNRLEDVKMFHLETEQAQIHEDHILSPEITAFMEANNFALVDVSHEWGWLIKDQVWVNKALVTKNKDCFTNTGAL